jgi:transcriptional/translational regulatory protein YebC/TACO1
MANLKTAMPVITRLPKNTVDLDVPTAKKVLKPMDTLDDHDNAQKVAANFNIPDEAIAEIETV